MFIVYDIYIYIKFTNLKLINLAILRSTLRSTPEWSPRLSCSHNMLDMPVIVHISLVIRRLTAVPSQIVDHKDIEPVHHLHSQQVHDFTKILGYPHDNPSYQRDSHLNHYSGHQHIFSIIWPVLLRDLGASQIISLLFISTLF